MIFIRAYSCSVQSHCPIKCSSISRQFLFSICRNIFTSHTPIYVQTYYEILGVKSSCSQKEIRSAYLELCKKYHPDKLKVKENKPHADNARFQKINEAYDCLSRVNDRSRYDLSLKEHDRSSGGHQASTWQHHQQYQQNQQYYYYAPPRRHPRYQENFYRMHYRNNKPNDKNVNDFKLFGSTITTFTVLSLLVVIVLQVYDEMCEFESKKRNTEKRYEAICKIYNQNNLYKDNAARNHKNSDLFRVMDVQKDDKKIDSTESSSVQQ